LREQANDAALKRMKLPREANTPELAALALREMCGGVRNGGRGFITYDEAANDGHCTSLMVETMSSFGAESPRRRS